jgi:nucleotide-binding universal stress UspA family protein
VEKRKAGFGTVVVGVDFTLASEAVAKWVGGRLPTAGTTILVHALEITRHSGETSAQKQIRLEAAVSANESLARLATEFFADRDVELLVEPGEPASVLSTLSVERDADLIVVGPHQGHPALEKFVGSTAHRLMHESIVPVLLAVGIEQPAVDDSAET